MNKKLTSLLARITGLIVVLLAVTSPSAAAAPVSGKIVEVYGEEIVINAAGSTVNMGDRVEVSFRIGNEILPIGTWRVTQVTGNRIRAKSEVPGRKAQMGMTAEIFPAGGKAEKQETVSAKGKESELFWLEEKEKPAAKTPEPAPASPAATPATKPIRTMTTNMYQMIWNDSGSGAYRDFASFRPLAEAGFYPLGDVAAAEPWPGRRYAAPAFNTILVQDGTMQLKPPTGYRLVWTSDGSFSDKPFSSWAPIAPEGYKCLGDVGSPSVEMMPSVNAIRCLPDICVTEIDLNEKIWDDKGSGAKLDFSAWRIPTVNLYAGTASHEKPRGTFYTISAECL